MQGYDKDYTDGATTLDNLKFKGNDDIENHLDIEDLIIFTVEVLKYNRFKNWQIRNLLLTDSMICSLDGTVFKRSIRLASVVGITKHDDTGHRNEFIVHVADQYDYLYICKRREQLITLIKKSYFKLKNKNLPIYGVKKKDLSKYLTTKLDAQKGVNKIPPAKFRLENEDTLQPQKTDEVPSPRQRGEDIDSEDELLIPKREAKARTSTIYAAAGDTETTLEGFELVKVIGRGSFGKVFLVKHTDTGDVYAMKALRKDQLLEKQLVEATILEKNILT